MGVHDLIEGKSAVDECRRGSQGGGDFGWEPGEWTDDTSMAIAIAERGSAALLDEAEAGQPSDFEHNGWVVQALQGVWSAVANTVPTDHDFSPSTAGPAHLRRALEAAVRGGRDTDTFAAVAGALIGGLCGASAIPAQWRRKLHGWTGLRARDLVTMGMMTALGGEPDSAGWRCGQAQS